MNENWIVLLFSWRKRCAKSIPLKKERFLLLFKQSFKREEKKDRLRKIEEKEKVVRVPHQIFWFKITDISSISLNMSN